MKSLILPCIFLVAAMLQVQIGHAAPRIGYIVVDANSGRIVDARSKDQPFMAASTMKLVTALAALDRLGPEHRFETSLSTTGNSEAGILNGDVILRGQGDVELDLDDLMQMVLALRAKGIRSVNGRFLVADGHFASFAEINEQQPLDAPYNAGIGPLSLAFGRVEMRYSRNGSAFANPALIERGPAWDIAKNLPKQRARAIPVRDVGMHTARSLRGLALQQGIDLPIPTRGSPKAQPRKLLSVWSKPLSDIVEGMLVYSNNQIAETLGLATAASLKHQVSTLQESASALWQDLLPRLGEGEWDGFNMTNHSGLDPNATITPAQLAILLAYGLDHHALPHMLPANGWSGSLRKRLVDEDSIQRIWAKTGSLDFAAAIAGFLTPAEGGLYIFALLTDDPGRRAVYDSMEIPSPAIRQEAQDWEISVKKEHDKLLRHWLSSSAE